MSGLSTDRGPGRGLGVGEVRAWALAIVGVAYWLDIVRPAVAAADSPVALLTAVIDNGAFDVFAWALLLGFCRPGNDRRPAGAGLLAGVALLGIIVLIPSRLASGLALVLAGLLLFSGQAATPSVRPLRLVLFGLALETLWQSPLLAPLHTLVASGDARVVGLLLTAFGPGAAVHGNVVENSGARFAIEIWPYCAASYPLADVALAFVTLVLYRGLPPRWVHLRWLALSLAASVVLTEIRLVLLSGGAAAYEWWHDGTGNSLYSLVAVGAAVVFPMLATRNGMAPPAEALGQPATSGG